MNPELFSIDTAKANLEVRLDSAVKSFGNFSEGFNLPRRLVAEEDCTIFQVGKTPSYVTGLGAYFLVQAALWAVPLYGAYTALKNVF